MEMLPAVRGALATGLFGRGYADGGNIAQPVAAQQPAAGAPQAGGGKSSGSTLQQQNTGMQGMGNFGNANAGNDELPAALLVSDEFWRRHDGRNGRRNDGWRRL